MGEQGESSYVFEVSYFCLGHLRGALYRGCFREETRRDPDDDRDATWSWSREIAD